MDKTYEERYVEVEESHPWFVARREIFSWFAGPGREARILDVGCGTGVFLSHLRAQGFERLEGVEISEGLRQQFRDPSIRLFAELPDERYDKIFMLDVLEHIGDDRGMLRRIHRMLEPGGSYYVSVPAHPFLWSRHDEVNQHQRRYRKRELSAKLREAGFMVRRLSHWNMFAFPLVCAGHFLGSGQRSGELDRGSAFSLWVYGGVLGIENWLVKRVRLPMGLSLIAVAEKATPGEGSG